MQLTPFQNDLFLILFSAAVIHSIYLAFLLFFKSRKERGVKLLGIVMICLSLLIFNYLLYIADWMRIFPHMLGVFAPFVLLIGPAYYFFVVRSVKLDHQFQLLDILHLIPFFYVLIEWMPYYWWSLEGKLKIIQAAYSDTRPAFYALLLSNRHLFLILGYLIASFFFLSKQESEQLDKRKRWLLKFTRFFAVFLIIDIGLNILFWWFNWPGSVLELSLVLVLVFAIHLASYMVLGKEKVLPDILHSKDSSKYANSPLNAVNIEYYKKQIIKHLESDKPWLNPDFSVKELAGALNIPRHYISQILTEGLQTNFYDLISQYRIAEVQHRLLAGKAQQYSILGVATECGFGSKSSFNRAFKKNIGQTPSQWLKMAQHQQLKDE